MIVIVTYLLPTDKPSKTNQMAEDQQLCTGVHDGFAQTRLL
jgi:hypothetical protein